MIAPTKPVVIERKALGGFVFEHLAQDGLRETQRVRQNGRPEHVKESVHFGLDVDFGRVVPQRMVEPGRCLERHPVLAAVVYEKRDLLGGWNHRCLRTAGTNLHADGAGLFSVVGGYGRDGGPRVDSPFTEKRNFEEDLIRTGEKPAAAGSWKPSFPPT